MYAQNKVVRGCTTHVQPMFMYKQGIWTKTCANALLHVTDHIQGSLLHVLADAQIHLTVLMAV